MSINCNNKFEPIDRVTVHFVDYMPNSNGSNKHSKNSYIQLAECDFDGYEKFEGFRRKINTHSLLCMTHFHVRSGVDRHISNRILKQVNPIIRFRNMIRAKQPSIDFFVKFNERSAHFFDLQQKMQIVHQFIDKHSKSTQELNCNAFNALTITETHVTELFQFLIHFNIPTLQALACTNQIFNKYITELSQKIDFDQLCPQLKVAHIKSAKLNNDCKVNKLSVLIGYNEMLPKAQNNTKIILCTCLKELNLQNLIKIAEKFSIKIHTYCKSNIPSMVYSPDKTHSFLVSEFPLKHSDCDYEPSVKLEEQENYTWIGCEMAPFHEYLYSSLVIEICRRNFYGINSDKGINSMGYFRRSLTTLDGFPVLVVTTTPEGILIQEHYNDFKENAAGLRRITQKSNYS